MGSDVGSECTHAHTGWFRRATRMPWPRRRRRPDAVREMGRKPLRWWGWTSWPETRRPSAPRWRRRGAVAAEGPVCLSCRWRETTAGDRRGGGGRRARPGRRPLRSLAVRRRRWPLRGSARLPQRN